MDTPFRETCPSCKLKNKPGAILCEFCGTPLTGPQQDTRRTDRLEEEEFVPQGKAGPFEKSLVPQSGLGIYLENSQIVTIMRDDEIILGRQSSVNEEFVIDLVPFGALQMGVSRRHATIRRVKNVYEITDLGSTNGTWVNTRKLISDEPEPLHSGDMIRLGRLHLLVLYKK